MSSMRRIVKIWGCIAIIATELMGRGVAAAGAPVLEVQIVASHA